MTSVEAQHFFENVKFPCTYEKLLSQCEMLSISDEIVAEIKERFEDGYGNTSTLIDVHEFPEIEYFHGINELFEDDTY